MSIKTTLLLCFFAISTYAKAQHKYDIKIYPKIGYFFSKTSNIPNYGNTLINSTDLSLINYFGLKTEINKYDVELSLSRFEIGEMANGFSKIGNYFGVNLKYFNLGFAYRFNKSKWTFSPNLYLSKKLNSVESIFTYNSGAHRYEEPLFSKKAGIGFGMDVHYTFFKKLQLGFNPNYMHYFEKKGETIGIYNHPSNPSPFYASYKPLSSFLNFNFYVAYGFSLKK